MMQLSTLWKVDRTVMADGSSPIAQQILTYWDHDQDSVRFFRSSANFVYVFRDEGSPYFLRFADSSERTRAAIEAEVDLLNWLARAGMNVARPVRSRDQNFVESVMTGLGTFHAVVFAALEGSQLDIGDLDDSRFRAWGAALGELHAAMRNYRGPGLAARSTWRDMLNMADTYIADEPAIRDELNLVASSLGALPVTPDTYGLVHFDFELDNLYWRDHRISILDFDDCTVCWYVADIAFALRDLFDDHVDLDNTSFRAFVQGYAEHYPLDGEFLAQIPIFLRMADLLTYTRLVRALDLPPDGDYPAWLEQLSDTLKNWTERYKRRKVQERQHAYGPN